jgi:glucose-6-phosphate 1-dehydrogenase
MLLPGLMELKREGQLPEGSHILIVDMPGRTPASDAVLRSQLHDQIREMVGSRFDEAAWRSLSPLIHAQPADSSKPADMVALRDRIDRLDGGKTASRLFYFALPDRAVPPVMEGLAKVGLLDRRADRPQVRVIIEKPIGHDESSARERNDLLEKHVGEDRTYRIDHYLGKAGIDRLLELRGRESLRRIWNKRYVDRVEVDGLEELGVGTRAGFYESTGATRDMVQSHLLQLLALTLMEAAPTASADKIRAAKLKVLQALPRDPSRIKLVRGQYRAGGGAPGYTDEPGVAKDSQTETFVALKTQLDLRKWRGVTVHLRTGKRLSEKNKEVRVHFKRLPHELADSLGLPAEAPAVLRIGMAPGEIPTLAGKPIAVGGGPRGPPLSSHARLLADVMAGDMSRFLGRAETETSWHFVDAALRNPGRLHPYRSGTPGPREARRVLPKRR